MDVGTLAKFRWKLMFMACPLGSHYEMKTQGQVLQGIAFLMEKVNWKTINNRKDNETCITENQAVIVVYYTA